MGSSTRKKTSKKADFQKPKLKVGKARPKPTNFTDTSFKSKGISLAHQSLTVSAPTPSAQFTHNISLLTSRSDPQRRDALASLTHALHILPTGSALPLPLSLLLSHLSPLLLDGSSSVRAHVIKLLRAITDPERRTWRSEVAPHIEKFLLYVRAGMTHLASGIRETATEAWIWSLDIASEETVSCAGGWIKGCKTLCVVLGWPVVLPDSGGHEAGSQKKTVETKAGGGWSNVSAAAGHGASKAGSQPVALLSLLSLFLRTGLMEQPLDELGEDHEQERWPWMLTHTATHMLPKRSDAYGYLNLFGGKRDEEGECYTDCVERQSVFRRMGFETAITTGLEASRREGGEVGRLAIRITNLLKGSRGTINGA